MLKTIAYTKLHTELRQLLVMGGVFMKWDQGVLLKIGIDKKGKMLKSIFPSKSQAISNSWLLIDEAWIVSPIKIQYGTSIDKEMFPKSVMCIDGN